MILLGRAATITSAKALELFTKGFTLGVTAYKAAKVTNRRTTKKTSQNTTKK